LQPELASCKIFPPARKIASLFVAVAISSGGNSWKHLRGNQINKTLSSALFLQTRCLLPNAHALQQLSSLHLQINAPTLNHNTSSIHR
jgi:hypothetical protein